jgi:hypothetical protein
MGWVPKARKGSEAGGARRRRPRWVRVLIGLAIVGVLMPVRVNCGHVFYACAALGLSGRATYYFEVEPLGVTVVETLLGFNMGLYYYASHSAE